jgi:hypothetical protein
VARSSYTAARAALKLEQHCIHNAANFQLFVCTCRPLRQQEVRPRSMVCMYSHLCVGGVLVIAYFCCRYAQAGSCSAWPVVLLPRGEGSGLSGGWRGFAIDQVRYVMTYDSRVSHESGGGLDSVVYRLGRRNLKGNGAYLSAVLLLAASPLTRCATMHNSCHM